MQNIQACDQPPPAPATAGSQVAARRARRKASLTAMDKHIGSRLRLCRTSHGLSLQQIGKRVGITYQQAHKYERGQSRLPACLLHEFAATMGMEPSWFFEGFGEAGAADGLSSHQRLCLEVSRSFAAIGNDKVVEALAHMVRILAIEAAMVLHHEPAPGAQVPASRVEMPAPAL